MILIDYLSKGQLIPVCVIFVIIIIGYYLGQLKIKNISFDLSGVLIVSVIFGALVQPQNQNFLNNMKFLSSLGTALFISVIGISSGYNFSKYRKSKVFSCLFVGVSTVIINLMLMALIMSFDKSLDKGSMYGVFCGAMTSTPGLAAVCEVSESYLAAATAGYACAYIFGVVGAVIFVQILSYNKKLNTEITKPNITKPLDNCTDDLSALAGLVLISSVIVFGYILGNFKIPSTHFSLGNSGGILFVGFTYGVIISYKERSFLPKKIQTDTIRDLGLMLFFVGTGIPAGSQLFTFFDLHLLIYGIVLTISPLLISALISFKIQKNNLSTSLSIISGTMTSTPAIGVLSRNTSIVPDTTSYSITYTGALITMIIFMRLITHIF